MGLHELDEFSSLNELKELQKSLFKAIDEKCEVHGEPLVQFQDNAPFCPVCASEKVAEAEQELMESGTEVAYNHKKRWLKERSLVVDKSLFNMNFDNYKATDEETETNKEQALDLAREYYKGSTKNGLLAGKFGTGKTHLAMAILNQLNMHKDQRNLFVSADELMRKVKSSIGHKESPFTEDRMIALLSKADLLVIDDMGAEVGSVNRNSSAPDFTIRVINGVLSGRTSKPTIFTTNLSHGELENAYDGRIVDRMFKGVAQEDIIQFTKTPSKRSKIQF